MRAELERRLLAIVRGPAPGVAREYACAKLALIGGPAAAEGLAGLLATAEVAHAAVQALQAMPGPEAGAALRRELPRVQGLALVGVINALGHRRDAASAGGLAERLGSAEKEVASAAVAALGAIATPEAARALREFLPQVPSALQAAAADACLVAAARLSSEGDRAAARVLLEGLIEINPPAHVRAAVQRVLAA